MNSWGPSDLTEAKKVGRAIECGYDLRLLSNGTNLLSLSVLSGAQKKGVLGPMKLTIGSIESP